VADQFGFINGKGTTNAIFIVRQMQEKFRAKGKKLYFGSVDLEKDGCVVSNCKREFQVKG